MARAPVRGVPLTPTVTGLGWEGLKFPSPRCPESPTPQHFTVPSPRSAHVCPSPLTTFGVAVLRLLTGRVGSRRERLSKVPSPSCPNQFCPKHCSVPSGGRCRQVWYPPADTASGVTAPPAVNCCVWPTEMVGLAGVTVMARAEATGHPRLSQRPQKPEAKSFNVLSMGFIETPSELSP